MKTKIKMGKTQKSGKKRLFYNVVSGKDRAENDFYTTPPEDVTTVGGRVGGYETPQYLPRGTPLPIRC